MFYYSHHIGDFVRDTARLNDSQCMAYLRLIWAYYDTEKPLDSTPEKLAFQVGAKVEDIQQILDHFFVLQDGVYVHTRCEKEITHFHKKSQSASASANARWKNAKGMRTHSERIANEPKSDANQEPRTKNQQIKKEATDVAIVLPDWIPLETWQAYLSMRKRIKKPPTDYAVKLLINKLNGFREKGQDVKEIIERSITSSWQDLYEITPAKQPVNRYDAVLTTVPGSKEKDPALVKLDEDAKKAAAPSLETLARLAALRQELKNG
jgi:uncharacterized protein YdaU (DUF1376 family)